MHSPARWRAALGVLAALGLGSAWGGADPQLARNLAASCATCHGPAGRPGTEPALPALAGRDQNQLLQKLRDFRAGSAPATIMTQISRGYSEAQLELIAAWFAVQR